MSTIQVKIDNAWYLVDEAVVARMNELYTTMADACQKYDALKAAVQDMRDKQNLYFKQPKAFNLLDDAKAAERIVDGVLSGKTQVNSEQGIMF